MTWTLYLLGVVQASLVVYLMESRENQPRDALFYCLATFLVLAWPVMIVIGVAHVIFHMVFQEKR